MINWADQRATVDEIKRHPFFLGADFSTLRNIEPPFVPNLRSITDTSYFPTDDYGNLPEQLEQVESVGAENDLAFLGCVPLSFFNSTTSQLMNDHALFRFTFKRFTGGQAP